MWGEDVMMEILKDILNVVLRIVGFLSIPILVVSIILMIKNLRRVSPVRLKGLVFQSFSPLVVFVIYALFLSLDPPRIASGLLFAVGLGLGILSSLTTRLGLARGEVVGQRSIWYLVAWAVTFSVTQLLAVFARSEYVAWGFSTLYFSLGLTLGTTGTLFARRQRILAGDEAPAELPPASPASAPRAIGATCPRCGEPLDAGARFCTRCGVRLA